MDKKRSDGMILTLKILKWSFLILLIFVGLFAILFGISMHKMQSALISEIIQYIDMDELNKIGSIDRKGIAINHHFIFYSFIISVSCLIMIIIFLCVSLLSAKKRLKFKYNQPAEADGANRPVDLLD
jgi:hypothetical protein